MFILINNIPYNIYDISSFNKGMDVRTNSDNTEVVIYCINYQISNGTALKVEYDSEEARDDAYDALVAKLVVTDEESGE